MDIDESTLQQKTDAELRAYVEELQIQLKRAQQKTRILENQFAAIRTSQVEQQKQTEVAEEFMTNKLFKQLEELQQEKRTLMVQVEQEEEYLTNTLQKKLDGLQQEKVDLENMLETEEEYIVNKLQKQLAEVAEEKNLLEKRLGEETCTTLEIRKYKYQIEDFRRKKDREMLRLQGENFGLKQQLLKVKQQFEDLASQTVELESGAEISEEREFNEVKLVVETERHRSVSRRAPRSISKRESFKKMLPLWSRKFIKRGWMTIQDGQSGVQTDQFFVLRDDGHLCGFDTENVEEVPEDNILTLINLNLVQKLEPDTTQFTLTLKGQSYQFSTPTASTWVELLREFLHS